MVPFGSTYATFPKNSKINNSKLCLLSYSKEEAIWYVTYIDGDILLPRLRDISS